MEYCGWSIKLTVHLHTLLILRMPGVHCHLPTCQMYPAQKAPSPTTLSPLVFQISIICLSTHRFPKQSLSFRCSHQTMMQLSPMHATCPNPSHPPSFDHPNNIWQAVQFTNLLISCNCLHSLPLPLSYVQIIHQHLFFNTLH
jgi:hypothetical protein